MLLRQSPTQYNLVCRCPLQAPDMLSKSRPALALALVALMATGASAACTAGERAQAQKAGGALVSDRSRVARGSLRAPGCSPPTLPADTQSPPRPAGSATFQLVAATTKTHPLAVCYPSMTVEISSACGEHCPCLLETTGMGIAHAGSRTFPGGALD